MAARFLDNIILLSLSLSLSLPTLSGTVDRLKVIAKEREGIPLNDDVQEVLHLCETVESIIRHLQKGTQSNVLIIPTSMVNVFLNVDGHLIKTA